MSETTLKTLHPTTLTIASKYDGVDLVVPVPEATSVFVSPGHCSRCGEDGHLFAVAARPVMSQMSLDEGVISEPYQGFCVAVGCLSCVESGDTELRLPYYIAHTDAELAELNMATPGLRPSDYLPGVAWAAEEVTW